MKTKYFLCSNYTMCARVLLTVILLFGFVMVCRSLKNPPKSVSVFGTRMSREHGKIPQSVVRANLDSEDLNSSFRNTRNNETTATSAPTREQIPTVSKTNKSSAKSGTIKFGERVKKSRKDIHRKKHGNRKGSKTKRHHIRGHRMSSGKNDKPYGASQNRGGRHSTARGQNKEYAISEKKKTCSTCGVNSLYDEGTVRNMRINMFIDTLAKKLRVTPEHLTSQLNTTKDRTKLPSEFTQRSQHDSPGSMEKIDDFYAKDKQIIIPGHDMGRRCIVGRTSGCYTFQLDDRVNGDVTSAVLWLYKTPDRHDSRNQTFLVYSLEKIEHGNVRIQSLIGRHETNVRDGWVVITISLSLNSWIRPEGDNTIMFAIRCAACATRHHRALFGAKHGYRPLVVIDASHYSRYRRQSQNDCDPRSECCKMHLAINFHEFLPNFLQPPHLDINYCYGSCDAINQAHYNHTEIKQQYRLGRNDVNATMRTQLKPCCVPVGLRAHSVMYQNADGGVVNTEVPNIVVRSCGCV